ncbi:MAG: DnaA N-terminal domain-containing protein, partial [Brachymonas sp.]
MTEGQVHHALGPTLQHETGAAIVPRAISLDAANFWPQCLAQLAQELPEQTFSTWIRPLQAAVAPDLSKLTVLVANRFKLDWVRAQYAGKISQVAQRLVQEAGGDDIAIELALAPRENPVKPLSSSQIYANNASLSGAVSGALAWAAGDDSAAHPLASAVHSGLLTEDDGAGGFKSRINTALSFDS